MKKRLILFILSFLCISVIASAFSYTLTYLKAAPNTYAAGGTATGRINKAPANLSGTKANIQMKKGDRYYLGDTGWQLLVDAAPALGKMVDEPSWLAMSTEPIARVAAFDSKPVYYIYNTLTTKTPATGQSYGQTANFDESNLYHVMNQYNNRWNDSRYASLIGTYSSNRMNGIHNVLSNVFNTKKPYFIYTLIAEYLRTGYFGKKSFLMCHYDLKADAAGANASNNESLPILTFSSNDLKFSSDYFTQSLYEHATVPYGYLGVSGTSGGISFVANSITVPSSVRPSMFIQKNNIVFGLSQNNLSGTGMTNVETPRLPANYTNISTDAVGETMKIRYHDAAMNASLNTILNEQEVELKKNASGYVVTEGTQIKLRAVGNTANSNSVLSAIIFNANGDFIGYQQLGNASGSLENYDLDISSLAAGDYQIAVVNEVSDDSDEPVKASLISDVKKLTVVKALSDLRFTAKQDLEYSKNVNVGNNVGTISSSNGVDTVVYKLVEDSAYPGESSDLEIGSDGKSVVVKNNALHAGTYHFKLQAQDGNGYPIQPLEIAATITVQKTALTVTFDDPNTTKKSITDAATPWSETATANPSTGTKITYSKSGGYSALIEIDSDTGEITYNGNDAFNKVTIRATVDDDPSTGLDNYNPAYVEKEIIIYRGVNATVTPDSASSDTSVPTFTASQANVMGNGVIGTITGNEGTPDTIGGSTTTYSYQLVNGQDSGMFQLTTSGNVGTIKVKAGSQLGVGSYHFTIRVSDKWSSKDIAVTVNVGVAGAENLQFYETSAAINMITTKSVKVTDTNVTVFATVKGSTNTNPVKYKIEDGSTNVIEVNQNSGAVTIHEVGTVTIVAEKQGASGQADAQAKLTFTVTAGTQNFIYTDNAGNELPKSGSNYSAKTDTYAPNKSFQLYTAGNPTGSTVTYQLKAESPTDVISVDANGLVTILNASLNNQMGRVIIQAISHDPTGNYSDKTIELPINIEKGTRTISFKENPIYAVSGNGSVTPVIEVDGVIDTDGDVLIEVDHNEDSSIAWTSDNKTIEYDYSEPNPKDIKIHATKPMNRNYKAAEADGVLHIMGPDENVLAITSPGKITYGDHFTIRSSQYDADSTNVQYKFEVDDTTYISNPTVSGNSAAFDALQFSGTVKTTITVTRTADGESPLSKQVQVTVLPKPIEIVIDDKEKLKGEVNPSLTYRDFKNKLVSWNGVQDVIQANDIKLSTTAKTNSNAGSYPIKGDSNTLNKTYPNYSFTFKEGTLKITEENIEDDWYHLELDDGNNTAYTGEWTNQNVNIISDHNEYINLSLDGNSWNPSQVSITSEGETNQSFWMKKDSGAITKVKQEIIRIDKTAPKVKGIKAKDTNNKLQDIINKISGGIFFKPGTSFEITTDDSNDDLKVSGTKEISYKVYKTEKQSRAGDELIKDGTLTVTKEKASITISELTGSYKVCVTPTDNAGNTNTESCHEVELKKIDVDVDGDGKPDFNDPDGDGCPDLNIKWKDPENPDLWIVVNGDRNYDGLPDLNIDSDGDGTPNLNIDTDNDGKPDLNLVILKKGDWKPTKCVKADPDNGILEEYCTGTSVKPVINVDTDNDGVPNINIDTNGDMKADLNITKKDSTEPYLNIILPQHVWEPNKDYKSGSFSYDSIGKHDPIINIDTDGDGRPDVNIDLDGDLEPDINIDTDGDLIPNIDIDSDGDGKPDVNVDTDGDGKADENIIEIKEWKPNKNVDSDFPYDTMDFDESKEPIEPNQSDTSVKGQYNPATSMGGANTGDNTTITLYISLMLITSVPLGLIYKKQKDTFQ